MGAICKTCGADYKVLCHVCFPQSIATLTTAQEKAEELKKQWSETARDLVAVQEEVERLKQNQIDGGTILYLALAKRLMTRIIEASDDDGVDIELKLVKIISDLTASQKREELANENYKILSKIFISTVADWKQKARKMATYFEDGFSRATGTQVMEMKKLCQSILADTKQEGEESEGEHTNGRCLACEALHAKWAAIPKAERKG